MVGRIAAIRNNNYNEFTNTKSGFFGFFDVVNDYDVEFDLFDTYRSDAIGGTGETFDWRILKDFEFLRPEILSGGLNPDNIKQALLEVLPYGVDVSTGVEESYGKKSLKLMKKFVEEVRKV